MHPSAHVDTFTRDNLPPQAIWPELQFRLPELDYPAQLNCVTELVDRQVGAGIGHQVAIRSPELTWTYADLQKNINRIANVLTGQLGVQTGNRVLLRFPNSPLFAASYLAVMKAGAVAVPTMPLLRQNELAKIIDKAAVTHALCDARLSEELAEFALQESMLSNALLDAMASADDEFDAVPTASDDVALIAFTSGTTGQPKGCMHFHSDVMSMCHTFCTRVLKPEAGRRIHRITAAGFHVRSGRTADVSASRRREHYFAGSSTAAGAR